MTSLRSLVALWLPLPAFAACCWLLAKGDIAVQDGVPDLDPLFGLTTLFILAVCLVGGFVSLVLAIVGTAAVRSRAGLVLGNAIWASTVLVSFTLYLAVVTLLEPDYADSSTLGDQVPYQVAAAVVALLPIALTLVDRRSARAPALVGG